MKTSRTAVACGLGLLLALGVGQVPADEYRVWSGGIGADERDAAPDGSLKLVLFEEGGKYVTDVDVVIFDGAGREVVKTRAGGPWVIVDLPPGAYRVVASRATGDPQGAAFHIEGRGQREVGLRFSDRDG